MIMDLQMDLSLLAKIGFSLRYEITMVVVLLVMWCVAQVSKKRQKPAIANSFSPLPLVAERTCKTKSVTPSTARKHNVPSELRVHQRAHTNAIKPTLLCDP